MFIFKISLFFLHYLISNYERNCQLNSIDTLITEVTNFFKELKIEIKHHPLDSNVI